MVEDLDLLPEAPPGIRTICAWCGKTIQGGEMNPVSHGICASCFSDILTRDSTSLKEFVEQISVPVLVVDGDVKAALSNNKTESLLQKESREFLARTGGDIFDCVNSKGPGGCGASIHCLGCTIRNCVEDTYKTGNPHIDIPATLKVELNADLKDTVSRISTVRIEPEPGRHRVVLSIRDFHEEDKNGEDCDPATPSR
jgi:hypothetical protein